MALSELTQIKDLAQLIYDAMGGGGSVTVAELLQAGSGTNSVFKDAADESVFTDASGIGVFVKQSDGGSVFRDADENSVFGDVVEQSVFKSDGGGSVFRYKKIFVNSVTNPASPNALQVLIQADIDALTGTYAEISNAQLSCAFNPAGDLVCFWTFWLV